MELLSIKQKICSALHSEQYSRGLRKIAIEDCNLTDFVALLDDIVDEQHLHSPKDLPYQYGVRKHISAEYRTALMAIADWDIHILYAAKIYDYLWVIQRNHQSGSEAFRKYMDYILTADKTPGLLVALYRLIDIGERIDIEHKTVTISKAWLHLYSMSDIDKRYLLLKCAFEYQIEIGDSVAEKIRQELTACKDSVAVNLVEAYAALFEKAYSAEMRAKDKNAGKGDTQLLWVRRQLVDVLVSSAQEPNMSLVHAIHMYEKAILTLKLLPHTEEERKQLRVEMATKQKQLHSQMKVHHHEMDVSVILRHMYATMDGLSKDECLNYLARFLTLFDLSKSVSMMKGGKRASLVDFFPAHIMDAEGRTTAVLPPIGLETGSDAIEAHAIRNTIMEAEIDGFFIVHILRHMEDRHTISIDDVKRIVDHSAFVSSDRKELYAKGLFAGFQRDFMTALNILIPQMEHSVRQLLQASGVVVYNLKEDGTEEAKTLNGLLELKETQEILESNLVFTLQAVFCSKYGLNLRNESAHGLLPDSFYRSTKAYFAWWLIFRLCYWLNARVLLQITQRVTERLAELNQLCSKTNNEFENDDDE